MKVKYEHVPRQHASSFYAYYKKADQYCFDMHNHPQHELVYFVSGKGKVCMVNTSVDYNRDDLVLIGPNVPHTFVSKSSDNQAVVIQFSHEFLGDQLWKNQDLVPIGKLLEKSQQVLHFEKVSDRTLVEKIVNIPDKNGLNRLMLLLGVLNALCLQKHSLLIHSAGQCILPKQSKLLLNVINYLRNHFTDNITAETLAGYCEMSESGFMKFFRRNMGQPFNDYLLDLRIEMACDMLRDEHDKVIEICYKTGFNNLSNFNRQFKKRKKMTPRQYRTVFSDF